ncbi:MAG TPA: CHC2 zinc finger domain-containing protein [Rubrivivax sp.]|nr:CHC2 zinc finger domain-containing protein [Rubrivivax sp.]
MSFDRNALPDPVLYFEAAGMPLQGRGKWRTTRCDFHGGSDSMRVNTDSGGWCCMACGVSGGDVLAHLMKSTGADFIAAARTLGAWIEDGKPSHQRPRRISPSDAMHIIGAELNVCVIVISDARRGVTPTDSDWQRFLQAASSVQTIAEGCTS